MSTPDFAIEMTGVDKRFGSIQALDGANLRVARGTIHGLVGQNGAGKSTIIKVLAGIYKPDAGTMAIGGKIVGSASPAAIERLGVHFIHQERLLAPTATVAEAVFLRNEPKRGPFIDHWRMRRRAEQLVSRYFELKIDGRTLVRDLTTAQQKVVQIVRALAQDASVLVLDEPTAALNRSEVDSLFKVLRRLRADGLAIIFISHYMQEIGELCDAVTVMRNGTDVGVVDPKTTSIDAIISLMIARDVTEMYPARSVSIGEPVLEVNELSQSGAFDRVSFNVRAGEIVGLHGLLGSGAKEVLQCLFGLTTADGGTIAIDGRHVRFRSPAAAVAGGVAMVPEDRRAHGVALDLTVRENTTLASLGRYSRASVFDFAREKLAVKQMIERLAIKTSSGEALVRTLSGGNQQKVSLAKWLSRQSKVYILDEPTIGVDIAAKIEIYTLLNELAGNGAAVLVLSSDQLELGGVCDRVLVIYRGRLNGEFAGDALNSDNLLAAASGAAATPERMAS